MPGPMELPMMAAADGKERDDEDCGVGEAFHVGL